MNQGRIWCVVNPTVGLPLFLGSVAVTSLIVHFSVLSHTNWMSGYWAGASKAKAAMNQNATPTAAATSTGDSAFVISVAPSAAADGKSPASFVITVTPNSATTAKTDAVADSTLPRAGEKLVLAPTVSK